MAMSGTEFLASLPPHASPARERAIVNAVRAGLYVMPRWWSLFSAAKGHALILYVMEDALRLGSPSDSVRVNVCARTAQQLADLFGCILPTTRICDLVWEQAVVRITPCLGGAGRDMSDTSRMAQHHAAVEAKVAGQEGLVETVGKNWVLSNLLATHPGKAANYGWFDPKAPSRSRPGGHGPYPLWQPLGLAHDQAHVDYSQILRLVHRTCVLDGEVRDIVDVMRDSTLASLVSDEGVLHVSRLPGVAPEAQVLA